MKSKDLQAVRLKTSKELIGELSKKQYALVELSLRIKSGDSKNMKGARNARRDIAQLKTILREKELEGIK